MERVQMKDKIKKRLLLNRKRITAFALAITMILTNAMSNVAVVFGAENIESSSVQAAFHLDAEEIKAAVLEALENQEVLDEDSLKFTKEDGSNSGNYEALFYGGRDVYEIHPPFTGDVPEGASLRVFVRSDSKDGKTTGNEEIVFLFVNDSYINIRFQAVVNGHATDEVLVPVKSVGLEEEVPPVKPEVPEVGTEESGATEESKPETGETTESKPEETEDAGETKESQVETEATVEATVEATTEATVEATVGATAEAETQPEVKETEVVEETEKETEAAQNDDVKEEIEEVGISSNDIPTVNSNSEGYFDDADLSDESNPLGTLPKEASVSNADDTAVVGKLKGKAYDAVVLNDESMVAAYVVKFNKLPLDTVEESKPQKEKQYTLLVEHILHDGEQSYKETTEIDLTSDDMEIDYTGTVKDVEGAILSEDAEKCITNLDNFILLQGTEDTYYKRVSLNYTLEDGYIVAEDESKDRSVRNEWPGVVKADVRVTNITLDKRNMILALDGEGQQLSATVMPENATNKGVIWSSEDESIALVTEDGLVTPVSSGKTVITCTSKENQNIKVTCAISVEAASFRLIFNSNFPVGAKKLVYTNGSETTELNCEDALATNASYSVTPGSSKEIIEGFDCLNYDFKEWNTKSDGSGVEYQPGKKIDVISNVSLYAVWENKQDVEPHTQTIKYYKFAKGSKDNNNKDNVKTKTVKAVKVGKNVKFILGNNQDTIVNNPSPKYWKINDKEYELSSLCTLPFTGKAIEVYPVFVSDDKVAQFFVLKRGKAEGVTEKGNFYSVGNGLLVDNYNKTGRYEVRNGSVAAFIKEHPDARTIANILNIKIEETEDIRWYVIADQSDGYHVDGVIYNKNVFWNVRFHNNNKLEKTMVVSDSSGVLANQFPDMKGNNTFDGWVDSSRNKVTEINMVSRDMDLYASYKNLHNVVGEIKPIDTGSIQHGSQNIVDGEQSTAIIFNTNSGHYIDTITVTKGSDVTRVDTGAGKTTTYTYKSETIKGDVKVSVTTKQDEKVTLTYDSDTGDATAITPSSQEIVNAGERLANQGKTLAETSRPKYTFGGWFTERDGKGSQFDDTTIIEKDITVYAKWIYNGEFQVWQYYIADPGTEDYGSYIYNFAANLPAGSGLMYNDRNTVDEENNHQKLDIDGVNKILTSSLEKMQIKHPGAVLLDVYMEASNGNDWVHSDTTLNATKDKVVLFPGLKDMRILSGESTRLTLAYMLPTQINVEYWVTDGTSATIVPDAGYALGTSSPYIYEGDKIPVSDTADKTSGIRKAVPKEKEGYGVENIVLKRDEEPGDTEIPVDDDGNYVVPYRGDMTSKEITVCVMLKAGIDTNYKVAYHYETEGQYSETPIEYSKDRGGVTDTIVAVTEEDKIPNSGYILDTTKVEGYSKTLSGDGTTVLDVYFKQQFEIEYSKGDYGTFETIKHKGIYYNVTTPKAPSGNELTGKDGYTFKGWKPEIATSVTENATYTAQWTANENTKYTVEHWLEELNGKYILKDSENNLSGVTDTETDVTARNNYIGFAYDRREYKSGDKVVVNEILGDGSLTVKLYYTRNSYSVTYQIDDGEKETSGSHKFGATVSVKGNPEKPGYTFSDWKTTDLKAGYIQAGAVARFMTGLRGILRAEENISGKTFTMPAQNVEIRGKFSANTNTSYTVKHYYQDVEGNGYTQGENSNLAGTTGDIATYEPSETLGFVYAEGKTVKNPESGIILGNGNTVIELYYDRLSYELKYKYNNAPEGTELPEGRAYRYGEDITYAAAQVVTGYTFEGWKVNEASNLPATMPAKDVEVIGSFSRNDYPLSVSYQYEDGTTASETVSRQVGYNEPYSVTSPIVTGHTADTSVVNGVMGTDGRTVIVTYKVKNHTVTYLIDGETYGEVDTYSYGAKVPVRADAVRNGYTFGGWSTTGEFTMPDDDVTIIGSFNVNSYTVSYEVDGSPYGTPQEYSYGTDVTVADSLSKPGYTFSGWSSENITIANNLFTMPAENVTLKATFSVNQDTKYTVEHWLEDLDGEYTIKDSTDNLTGETDIATNVTEKDNYIGFAYARREYKSGDEVVANKILGDGSLTVKLYYVRNSYNVTYQIDDGDKEKSGSYKFEATVSVKGNPEKLGYTFSDWNTTDLEAGDIQAGAVARFMTGLRGILRAEENISGKTFTMPAKDVEIRGKFSVNTNTFYTVEHYYQDVVGDGYTLGKRDTNLAGTTDTPAAYEPSITPGFEYAEGKTVKNPETGIILGNGSTEIKLYYDRLSYDLNYEYSGAPEGAVLPEGGTYRYGESIQYAVAQEVAGYTFEGWKVNDISELPTTMPADNVEVIGSFSRNNYPLNVSYQYEDGTTAGETVSRQVGYNESYRVESPGITGYTVDVPVVDGVMDTDGRTVIVTYKVKNHTVTYLIDGEAYGEVDTYSYGATVPVRADAVRLGYKFSSWSRAEAFAMPDEDVIISGTFKVNSYMVSYEVDGSPYGTPQVYSYGENINVAGNISKPGYTFNGWDRAESFIMPAENVIIKGNYHVNQYTVTYIVDGEVYGSSDSYEYDSQVNVKGNPEQAGYTFSGWDRNEDFRMPAEDIVISGTFTLNSTGGGNTGGGSTGGGGGSSNRPSGGGSNVPGGPGDTETTTILPDEVPLANLPGGSSSSDGNDFTTIDDGEIPLASLPKTGNQGGHMAGFMTAFSGIILAAYCALSKKKEEK